jgi:aconitase A
LQALDGIQRHDFADLGTVVPSLAVPKRPQEINLPDVKKNFLDGLGPPRPR